MAIDLDFSKKGWISDDIEIFSNQSMNKIWTVDLCLICVENGEALREMIASILFMYQIDD